MIESVESSKTEDYLGNEFLTWILFLIETGEIYPKEIKEIITSFKNVDRIVMKKKNNDLEKKIEIKTNGYLSLEEAMAALRAGALVSEIKLYYNHDNNIFEFNIAGKRFDFSKVKFVENKIEFGKFNKFEDVVRNRISNCYQIALIMKNLFDHFIKLRVSNDWKDKIVKSMKLWIMDNG